MTTAVTVDQLRNLTNRAGAGLTPEEQARFRAGVDQLHYRLDQTRNAATLHRQGLITTAELYAVIEAALDTRPADDTTPAEPEPAATQATEPATSPLRDLIAAAIYERNNPAHRWADAHPDDVLAYGFDADAVLAVILPATRITATLARMSDADVQRVIALYERWVKAGPPPIGQSINRWWDRRLAELHAVLNPTKEQQ